MTIRKAVIPVAALAIAFGSITAASADHEDRGRSDRGARGDRGRAEGRDGREGREDRESRESRAERGDRDGGRSEGESRSRSYDGASRERQSDNERRGYSGSAVARDRDDRRYRDRDDPRSWSRDYDRDDSYRDRDRGRSRDIYIAPRFSTRPAPRRYYGRGGHLSIYFGIGSGYRYGSPYSGRVYGYRRYAYRADQSYGDVRLRIQPREAAVYVDGYYAGIVDDFDGFFQRLTLEVGPHQIEVEAPGLEPQVFDVYVDPYRTVDVRADLLR